MSCWEMLKKCVIIINTGIPGHIVRIGFPSYVYTLASMTEIYLGEPIIYLQLYHDVYQYPHIK